MSQSLLVVEQVYAGYAAGLDILQGANIEIHCGELVALIGPNGAGKSTLLKAIFNLLPQCRGQIELGGKKIQGIPPHQLVGLGMGYVPQLANVFPSLTVAENLSIGAVSSQGKILKDRLAELTNLFPILQERYHQRAGTLSGGERQLLAMARALMGQPRLLLLDEPSAALSPKLVGEVMGHIQQINRLGITVLLVEQNARQALKISHRGYVLDNGRECYSGAGQELLHDPRIGELYLGIKSPLATKP
ncbi:high-affinity branched-chain amino acid transport ATP-binding protein; BraG [Gloeomargarita lithophora Alchichica-D10]|uniref:High-affinity branched-chain amino acid transport ATP-binding protein BraG n=1 Tax=Gloeomargarita lithophora Alchichica-D10 TaxID=1188229 RepID=A0A1J0ABA1_9CYAN|nr:ABC transporter ATP-binding protein [Gloeomargarita lithophora]APB33206.1 high-affinity branched-chain amino acid transport ATP-binding protein; BraG [Gloeomargarita lithophora Alchichica-D10]